MKEQVTTTLINNGFEFTGTCCGGSMLKYSKQGHMIKVPNADNINFLLLIQGGEVKGRKYRIRVQQLQETLEKYGLNA